MAISLDARTLCEVGARLLGDRRNIHDFLLVAIAFSMRQ